MRESKKVLFSHLMKEAKNRKNYHKATHKKYCRRNEDKDMNAQYKNIEFTSDRKYLYDHFLLKL